MDMTKWMQYDTLHHCTAAKRVLNGWGFVLLMLHDVVHIVFEQ